jgi:hypothetical protein
MLTQSLCAFAVACAILAPPAFGYEQTDWSGGPGVMGPATEWADTFLGGDDVAWRSIADQLALASSARTDPLMTVIAQDADIPHGIAAADINGDGLTDVLSTAPVTDPFDDIGAVYWWQRIGEGQWDRHTVSDDFFGAYYVDAADVDGDGDMDVIVAAYYGVADPPPPPPEDRNGRYAWFENVNGDGSAWTTHLMAELYWGACWVDSGDVDGDGDTDVVGASQLTSGVYEQDGDIVWLENLDGAGDEWMAHDLETDFAHGFQAHLADLDVDGDLDVVGTDSGRVAWYENRNGDGSLWIRRFVTTDIAGAGYFSVGDIDSDGDPDLLGTGYNTAQIGWWENTAGNGTVWFPHYVVNASQTQLVRLADMNGDGDLDVLITRVPGDPTVNQAYWIESVDGEGVVWEPHLITADLDSRTWIVAADIDNDGKLDAAICDEGVYTDAPQLLWFNVTEFVMSGDLISTILDGGADPGWSTLDWDAEVDGGAALMVQVRASDDPENLGPFSVVPAPGQDLSELIDPDAQFFQYRLLLDNGGPEASPIVRSIDLSAGGLPGDIDGDGIVGTADLLMLLAAWGDCPDPPEECPADLDGDGTVGTADLLILLANWS